MIIEGHGDVLKVLELKRLSAGDIAYFKETIRSRLTAAHRAVEVDFSGVTFVDSEGLGALVFIAKLMEEQSGRLRVVKPQPLVVQLLERVQFNLLMDIVV